ncbi:hypothetical protein [Lentzea nigeriaca]|uniref:hypothetical protein n=1 Tax=Lentzea nigeriaca TaxID=1128665 RepID=UPI001EF99AFB|nr:hypothetical protein [Lentzea nigeriaca]MBM7857061.1 hypothetical protein [Lentzea nigeriaca]
MNMRRLLTVPHVRVLVACLVFLTLTGSASADTADGQRDFDWELGTWHTDVRVLADPLSDTEDQWLQFSGTSVVRPLMDRRANVVELNVTGPAGRIEGLNMRLHEPQAQRWSLTFVNMRDGLLTPSVYGGFHDGVGEFYGDDQLGGRPIRVRFLIHRQGKDCATFEQAFSQDGGKSWETNWIAVDRRT